MPMKSEFKWPLFDSHGEVMTYLWPFTMSLFFVGGTFMGFSWIILSTSIGFSAKVNGGDACLYLPPLLREIHTNFNEKHISKTYTEGSVMALIFLCAI